MQNELNDPFEGPDDTIPFTQYMRPYGTPVDEAYKCPNPEVVRDAHRLIERDFRFEAEVLTTNQVSVTIVAPEQYDPDEVGDIAIQVCGNGPEIHDAIKKLVEDGVKYAKEQGAL